MGIVYFLQAVPDGNIKIGFTTNLPRRLSAIQSSSPVLVQVLFWFPGTQEDEEGLHNSFKHHNLHGEWYSPHKDIKRYVSHRLRARKAALTRRYRNAARKAWITRRARPT